MEVQLQTAPVCSVYEEGEKKKANFHTEFVIVRDLAFVSRGGCRKAAVGGRGWGGVALPVLSGSPERRIMGLGCGVRHSLSGFDHTIASSIEKQKNSAGQNRLSLLRSHYAHCLSPHFSSSSLFFFSHSLFISITHIQTLLLLTLLFYDTHTHTHPHPHTHTLSLNEIMH